MRRNKKKKIIITGLLGVLFLMTVGYAAFQTNLDITGTSKVSSNWNVLITNVTESSKEGEAETVGTPSWTDLTAYMEANLYQKGDFVEYDVTVENRGTLDAKLESITDNIKSTNEAVKITFSGYTKGEKLYKNTTKTIKVKIEYNPDFTGTVEEGSGEVSVDLNYTQAEGGTIIPTDSYLVSYDCTTNGGTNCSNYNEYLQEGESVNLSHVATKKDYEFIGWNTNKDADEGLTELQMSNADVTLYALYEVPVNLEEPTFDVVDGKVSVTTDTSGTYAWTQTDGVWKSGNYNVNSSTSELSFNFTLTSAKEISFDWTVSSESANYDYVYYTIYKDGSTTAMSGTGTSTKIGGTSYGTTESSLTYNNVKKQLEAGTYKVTFTYRKDSSAYKGTDSAYVKNFEVVSNDYVTINYPTGCSNGYICSYSINNGQEVEVTSNTAQVDLVGDMRVVAKTSYGKKRKSSTKIIDSTPPEVNFNTSSSAKAVTVVANASDNVSDITKYEFKIDNSEWINNGTSNIYIFTGLEPNTKYNIEVRATNSADLTSSATGTAKTSKITPIFVEKIKDGKSTVTITFPEECATGNYTCSYIKNDETEVMVKNKTVDVEFLSPGNLVAKVNDGTDVFSSTYLVTMEGSIIKAYTNVGGEGEEVGEDFHSSDYAWWIKTATFTNTTEVPDEAIQSWDVSALGNGSVMAWVVTSEDSDEYNTYYDLYIGGKGGVVANENSSNLFKRLQNLTTINFNDNFDVSNITNMSGMFAYCNHLINVDLNYFDTSKVTDMSYMFQRCDDLTTIDLSNFDTSNVTNMAGMFKDNSRLANLNISSFNTSKVTNMNYMFSGCEKLTNLDVSHFDTSKVTDMSYMFNACDNLTNLDVNNFDTRKVTNMQSMFQRCITLATLDVSHFDTSNVINMNSMFGSCYLLTALDLSNFNTTKVTDMSDMFVFDYALSNLKVSNFDTSNVTNMREMFYFCENLPKIDICNFDTSKVTNMDSMFGYTKIVKEVLVGPLWVMPEGANILYGSAVSSVTKKDACPINIDELTVDYSVSSTIDTITLVSTSTDESSIIKYEYSMDNGKNWEDGTSVYTLSNLVSDTSYSILARVTDKNGKQGNTLIKYRTKPLQVPTYSESGTFTKTINITYPEGCGDKLICSYIKDSGTEVPVTTNMVNVSFSSAGSLVGKVSDGEKTVSSSYTVTIPITINELKEKVVTSGDGLYIDTTEAGRYIYRGTNPNNYIKFNNETWRIMSVESDGTLKIIKDASIGNKAWDAKNTRSSSTSTYCTTASIYGCNAWAATSNLINTPSDFTLHYPNGNPNTDSTTYSGAVTVDSSLNTYLNTTYYNELSDEAKENVAVHGFNVGTPGNTSDTEDIATDVSQEAVYKWNGKVGLMNVTDFLKTTTNTSCTSLKVGYSNGRKSVCSNNNWLFKSTSEWTLSPYVHSDRYYVWFVSAVGYVNSINAYSTYGVRPVLYLTSDTHLDGEGTGGRPYIIS